MTQPDTRAQIRNAEAAWVASILQPALDKVPKAQQEMTTLSDIPIVPLATPLDVSSDSYLDRMGFPGQPPYNARGAADDVSGTPLDDANFFRFWHRARDQ